MPDIYDAIFLKALELNPGEQIYIPCEDKQEQKKTEKVIKEAISKATLDIQMQLRVARTFKDKKLWVMIARKTPLHSDFFVKYKTESGEWRIRRDSLETDATRLRVIAAMIEDGISEDEILESLGEISEVERKLFFPKME